jgi:hypothetical protein
LLTLLNYICNKQISTTYAEFQIQSLQIFQNVGNVYTHHTSADVVGDLLSREFLSQIKAILSDKYARGGCVTAERDESVREKAVLCNYTVIC